MSQIRYTAVGVFDNAADANDAVRELREKGFAEWQIHQTSGAEAQEQQEEHTAIEEAPQGAGIGMLVGASLGGLAGAGAGAVAGGVVGGLVGTFLGLGVLEEEAHFYQHELKAGHVLVTVNSDGRYDEAVAVLRRHGGRVDQSPLSEVGPGVLP